MTIPRMVAAAQFVIALVFAGALLSAQSRETPAVDVASVKRNHTGDTESASFVQPGGRYTATNVTLRTLIKTACSRHDEQVIAGPGWIDADRFDLAAKAEGYSTPSAFRDRARLMLRPLLTDRFTLGVRHERREIAVYSLALARADGRFGPQFRRSALAFNVSRWTNRVVVDRTGLEGAFDWDAQWVPDPLTPDPARVHPRRSKC